MNAIMKIASSTIRELYRDRILYVLIFFGVLLILLSLLLSNLSVQENIRLTINFSLTGIQLSLQVIAIFIGSTLIFREIEKKSILFVMSYPLSRTQFLLGKYFGFIFLLMGILISKLVILMFLLLQIEWDFHFSIFTAFWGIFLESVILLSLTMAIGVFAKPISVVAVAVGFFLAGHGLDSFKELALKSKSEFLKFMSDFFEYIIPNLENMNWRSEVVYSEMVALPEVINATVYTSIWSFFFIIIAISFFRRRDFV